MNKLAKRLQDYIAYIVFRVRPFTRRIGEKVSQEVKEGQIVLEIGSGVQDKRKEYYFSMARYFVGKGVDFIQSDLNPAFGYRVIDITSLNENSIYDHILCFHVLDDIYDWQQAIISLNFALKQDGYLHLVLPGFSLLDYDADYYRFTEKLFREFCLKNKIKIEMIQVHGFKRFPFAYYIKIKKVAV